MEDGVEFYSTPFVFLTDTFTGKFLFLFRDNLSLDISKALKAYLDDDAKRRFISEKYNDDDMSFITQTLHGKVLPKSLGKEGLRYVA